MQTFVANRVAEIQNHINPNCWHYVNTKLNPADHASRGLSTRDLKKCSHWWQGPQFLTLDSNKWPKIPEKMISLKNLPEIKNKVLFQQVTNEEKPMLIRYSSLAKLFRIKNFRGVKVILPTELLNSRNIWLRIVQSQYYSQEIQCLNKKQHLSNKSSILALTPTLDVNKVLRVYGRLKHAKLADDVKHRAILPPNGFFTTLVIRQAHEKTMHGDLQLTLRFIRETYWIVRGTNTVRNHINKCVTCFRY